jgi:phage shock protein PspC (stress-responsive transcriptional regulator)
MPTAMSILKKTKKRILCGVCGGIAKWIDPDINPAGIRALWAIITVFHPWTMIITYFLLAAILRTEIVLFAEQKEKTV